MSYEITDNCIGCTICAKNCPVDAINGNIKEKHVINIKRCVECGVCGNVCPKSAVLTSTGEIAIKKQKKDWKKPIIKKEECSACSMCVDICAFNSLAISYPKYVGDYRLYAELVNEKSCVSCSMCENICPLNAISMGEVY